VSALQPHLPLTPITQIRLHAKLGLSLRASASRLQEREEEEEEKEEDEDEEAREKGKMGAGGGGEGEGEGGGLEASKDGRCGLDTGGLDICPLDTLDSGGLCGLDICPTGGLDICPLHTDARQDTHAPHATQDEKKTRKEQVVGLELEAAQVCVCVCVRAYVCVRVCVCVGGLFGGWVGG